MIPIVIANWKMNLSLDEALSKVNQLKNNHFAKLLLAAPTPYLAYFAKIFPNINICAQNVSSITEYGAYTGEYNAEMLKSCAINYAIIGHSERRSYFNESNKTIRIKAENCIKASIVPIICIGEDLITRKNNSYKEFLTKQILESVPTGADNIIIAYEPCWAIGSGLVPKIEEIEEIFNFIKADKRITILAKNISLIYGGSVNSKNYEKIIKIPGNSGVILGGVSLNDAELISILNKKC